MARRLRNLSWWTPMRDARCGSCRLGQLAVVVALVVIVCHGEAKAVLNGFENVDGYSPPFPLDVWAYDAGQTGASFLPAQYNTGRWQELFGSSIAGSGSQYISQHGYGTGGANVPPSALAVRATQPSTDGSFDMTLLYSLGVDDLGVSPGTPLQSATIFFDICPGLTFKNNSGGLDNVFNDVPVFSLSFGGTNTAPGVTLGFTDHDPGNANKQEFVHYDGAAYQSQPVTWSGHFDRVQLDLDFLTQTFDASVTTDAVFSTTEFDAGNAPQVIATGASFTSAISALDFLYFRAHTDPSDPSDGTIIAGLEKSYLDNFRFSVKPRSDTDPQASVPEPGTLVLAVFGLLGLAVFGRRCKGNRAASGRDT